MKRITSIITILVILGFPGMMAAQSCWTNFRGDTQLRGSTTASIPAEPDLLWNFKTNDAIKASPVVCEGIIVAGSVDGNVYGITMEGKLKWKINTGNGIEAAALIHKGMVYVGNLDGKVLALELLTGKVIWTYETEGQIMGAPNILGEENILVIGSYDYYLHGIDAVTGKGLWKYESDNFINGSPAIYKGVAIFGGCDGLMHQVYVKDGSLKSREPVATYVAGSVAVDNWITFVGDYDGKFTSMDLRNGHVLWSYKNPDTDLPFIASPSLSAKVVFIGNRDKYVYCFSKADGTLLWKRNMRSRVDASPVLVKNRLVVATMRGDLALLDTYDGAVKWIYELGSGINGNPAVIDGRIIVGADDGRIYCFGKK
ncbi:MAG: PQQ-binding-like beta-propeller repeat protein [Bacteroidales bacterium]